MHYTAWRLSAVAAGVALFLATNPHARAQQSAEPEPSDDLDQLIEPAPREAQEDQGTTAAESQETPAAASPRTDTAPEQTADETDDPQTVPVADSGPTPPVRAPRAVIEEIVVTASRRSQSVQDVVGGIQALSGADLEMKGAAGFNDYLTQVPGTGFRQDGSGNTKIGVRGVSNVSGNQLGTFSGSSPVGIYINDVPIQGSGQLPDLDLYDLNRVEVLKGPQGTLYGEGAMGGAVRMIVNEPSADATELKGEIAVSNTARGGLNKALRLAGGMPLGPVAVKLVGSAKRDSGFIDLSNQGRSDANLGEAESGRLLANWQISDQFGAQLLYLKDLRRNAGSPNVRPETRERYANDIFETEMTDGDIDIGGLTLKYQFDDIELTAVSSGMYAQRFSIFRLALWKDLLAERGVPPHAGYREEPFHNDTRDTGFAQELRAVSTGDQVLNWIAGAYYQRRDQHYNQTSYIYESPSPGENRQLHRHGVQPMRQWALYGEGTYPVLENFELTLGLRAVQESIGINDFFETYGAIAAIQAAANDTNPKYLDLETRYTNYLPKVSLAWHVNDEVMAYALASRGYRSTTPNVQVNLGVGPPLLKADSLWNYELGAKTQWFDGALVANGSVYRIDWENLQATRAGEGHVGDVPVTVIYIDNIGEARVNGIEADLQLALGEFLTVGLGGAWQDGRLHNTDPDSPAIPGSRIPNSPEWTGNLSVGYSRPVFGDWTWTASATLQYVGEQGSREVTTFDPDGSPTADYTKLGAVLALDGQGWGATLFGDNLLDQIIELSNASLVETEHFTTIGQPRTVGLRLRYNFGP